jgi:hypothetical protein
MSTDRDVEQKILQCVDEALETLGSSGRKALLSHLEKSAGLKRKEIPEKPELFCNGLNVILGDRGGDVVKKLIVKRLLTGFGLQHKSSLTLAEAIKLVKAAQKKSR